MLLETGAQPLNAGQLNYVLSREVDMYFRQHGLKYATINDILGVLTAIQLEVYRRFAADYEDFKIKENGEVFHYARKLIKALFSSRRTRRILNGDPSGGSNSSS